jgi:hypothetical protein
MIIGAEQAVDLDRLDHELRLAPAVAPEQLRKVIESAATRHSWLRPSGKAARIDRLIEAGAWTDAAFALIQLEMPSWTVRRIIREDGKWLCSLSRQPNLPTTLDDPAEASHEVLPLAILRAFLEARRRSSVAPQIVTAVPQIRPPHAQLICCDNFA